MQDRGLLRFITCGSVDDGKSTLIGRMLYDAGLIYDDQLSALRTTSGSEGKIDFARLLDGLEAEQEQGITIDVAYRYFGTRRRSFVVSDCPGHERYTRNMATAASRAVAGVLLLDSRKGLLSQTRRHSLICSLLGVRHILLAVNKMDLVGYDEKTFVKIVADYQAFAAQLRFVSVTAIPISALNGDNVVTRSARMNWYLGPSLLDQLETVDIAGNPEDEPLRFPVQWVNRSPPDFRGYAGTIVSGSVRPGDRVLVRPETYAKIHEIISYDGSLPLARRDQAVTLTIHEEIDIGRGDILASPESPPEYSNHFAANIIWMDEKPLVQRRSYLIRLGTKTTTAVVTHVDHKLDVNTGKVLAADSLKLNDAGKCVLATSGPVSFDRYSENRATGAFILIDRLSKATVAAGMISENLSPGATIDLQESSVSKQQRADQKHQRPTILWFTGLSAAGKSTISNLVEQKLLRAGYHTMLLDGDSLRRGINNDLGFTEMDRAENIRRTGEIAKLMLDAGLIVICSLISPYAAERNMVRDSVPAGEFIEIFVDTPVDECMRRDPKSLYRNAKAGKLKNFTGVDAPYEIPADPEITLATMDHSAEELASTVLGYLVSSGFINHLV